MDSKKKMIIAISSCALVIIAAVIAVVAVLAAQTVTINNSVKVTYTVQDVVCDIEVYAVKVNKDASTISWGTAKTANFDINYNSANPTSLDLGSFENIGKNDCVVLKFVFNNNAQSAFTASLASPTAGTNFSVYYATTESGTSGVLKSTTAYGTGKSVSVASGLDQSSTMYVRIAVTDTTKSATINTAFNWTLTKA